MYLCTAMRAGGPYGPPPSAHVRARVQPRRGLQHPPRHSRPALGTHPRTPQPQHQRLQGWGVDLRSLHDDVAVIPHARAPSNEF